MKIPFDRLGIPVEHREKVLPDAPAKARLAIAKGLLPLPPDVLVACVYVLLGSREKAIRRAADRTLKEMDKEIVLRAISPRTHPKILEVLTDARLDDQEFMERVFGLANTNDRTACQIARAARGELVEVICRNQSRLLMTPEVYLALKDNPEVTASSLERVYSFLRMQKSLPEEPDAAPVQDKAEAEEVGAGSASTATSPLQTVSVADLTELSIEAEVTAALMGLPSPYSNPQVAARLTIQVARKAGSAALDDSFRFSFDDDADNFHASLITDEDLAPDEKQSLAQKIAGMKTGARIKLAFLGNAEARKILLRDKNKQVAVAVVKSGRMTDSEAAAVAANKNMHMDVLRELAMNKEFLRQYKVKLGLVNNPKCPVSVAVGLVSHLQRADLSSLARNKNVPSVVRRTAKKTIQNKLNG